ncbi:hypothetical protein SAY86_002472 [Trapa natans]|uniref:Uncharacterized protein n=1 Tax=Trapa natans TaxID=22666 RepID=A0AAN7LQA7_TRANT|nr:hypothetical protein SAY86_002472 [Trapa natans]
MVSSRKCAHIISFVASFTYLLFVIFQVPLFRVPCRIGSCESPLQVTSSQLIVSGLFPETILKVLLYPGAAADSVLKKKALPNSDDLLASYGSDYSMGFGTVMDLGRIEVLAGSYLMVVGALVNVIGPSRMSFFGSLIVTWGLICEVFSRKTAFANHSKAIGIYPTMMIAIVSAFCSMRKDVRRIVRICKKCLSKAKLI